MKAEWVVFLCFIGFGIVGTLILDNPKVRKITLKVFSVLLAIFALIYLAMIYMFTPRKKRSPKNEK